jgi:hypothetical protein
MLWHWLWLWQSWEMMLPAAISLRTSSVDGQHESSSPGQGVLGVVVLVVVAVAEMKSMGEKKGYMCA